MAVVLSPEQIEAVKRILLTDTNVSSLFPDRDPLASNSIISGYVRRMVKLLECTTTSNIKMAWDGMSLGREPQRVLQRLIRAMFPTCVLEQFNIGGTPDTENFFIEQSWISNNVRYSFHFKYLHSYRFPGTGQHFCFFSKTFPRDIDHEPDHPQQPFPYESVVRSRETTPTPSEREFRERNQTTQKEFSHILKSMHLRLCALEDSFKNKIH